MGFIKKWFRPDTPPAPATPAVSAPAVEMKQETGVETQGQSMKRKAKGKKGLMIDSGKGLGGTGLNV